MMTDIKRLFADTSGALAIAVLAISFTVGGSHAVRADNPESPPLSTQDSVLVPVKDLQALEQRVIYLEEIVTALSESWQHINTHRLCVSDDSGAETCISKQQLDALLMRQAPVAAISQAPAIVAVESVTVAKVTEDAEPAPSAVSHDIAQADQEPEYTGSVTLRVPAIEPILTPEPATESQGEQP